MDDFILLKNNTPIFPKGGIEQIVKRSQIIREICENTNTSYQTTFNNVYKLCKVCINDICTELIYLSNWQTKYYKSYNEYTSTKKDVDPDLLSGIQKAAVEAKNTFNNYKGLYHKFTLANIKLLTKECIICKETKPTMV